MEPQRGDRQPRQQRQQRALGNGERHPQRDQAARRQRADPARRPFVGEQRRAAGEEQPQQAEHGDRQQGDPQGSPGQAVQQRAVVVRRARPAPRSITSVGEPRRRMTSVPGTAWAGSSTSVQRAARACGNGRASVGKLTPAAIRQGRRASPSGCSTSRVTALKLAR